MAEILTQLPAATVALLAIGGALVTSITAIVVALLRGRQAHRNSILEMAIKSAHEDFSHSQQIAEKNNDKTYSMSVYVAFHYIYLKALVDGKAPDIAAQTALKEAKKLLSALKSSSFSDYGVNGKWKTD